MAYSTVILADSPELYLRMNDSTTTCTDSSTNANDGTYQNTPTLQQPGAIHLDTDDSVSFASGSAEHVDGFGNPAELQITGSLSLGSWIKTGTTGATQTIISKDDGTLQAYSLLVNTSNKVEFTIYISGAAKTVTSSSTVTDDKWHKVCGVHDGTDLLVYIDGALDAISYAVGGTIDNDAASVEIGARSDGSNYFDGELDEVAIYNTALTNAKVIEHFREGRPKIASGVLQHSTVGYWRLNETSGTFAQDLTGNGHDGTHVNTPTASSDGPIEEDSTTGSLDFDGVNQYVTIPDSADLSFGDGSSDDPVTFACWVKMDDATDFTMISKWGTNGEYLFYLVGDDKLRLLFRDDSAGTNIYSQSDIALTSLEGVWSFIAGTYDGTGGATAADGITLYIDGEPIASTSFNNGSHVAMEDLSEVVNIGSHSSGTSPANGLISEATIIGQELTASEVKSLYREGLSKFSRVVHDLSPVLHIGNNEASGTLARDDSGNCHHGTHVGSPTLGVTGPIINDTSNTGSGAVDYNGTTQYTTVPDSTDLSFGNGSTDSAFTMAAWVNMTDATSFTICSKYDTSAGENEYIFQVDGSDKIRMAMFDDGISHFDRRISDSAITASEGSYIFLAATYTGSGGSANIVLYQDGVVVASSQNDVGSYVAMHNKNVQFEIGSQTDASRTVFADGEISDPMIFPSALSAGDIKALYESSLSKYAREVMISQPDSYMRLGESSGTTTYDISGNDHNGTTTGSPTQGSTGAIPTDSDTAYTFDGTDDEITVSAHADIDNVFTGGGSFNIWCNPGSIGETFGYLAEKGNVAGNGWSVNLESYSAGTWDIELKSPFGSTTGLWESSGNAIADGFKMISMNYNQSSVNNDPIFFVNGEPLSITETQTPVGTVPDDSADDYIVGNEAAGTRTFDGPIDEPALFSTQLTSEQIWDIYKCSQLASIEGTITETITTAESLPQTFDDVLSDSATVGETLAFFIGLTIIETMTTEDGPGLLGTLSEVLVADSTLAYQYAILVAQSLTISDTVTPEAVIVITETLLALAAISTGGSNYSQVISETMDILDAIALTFEATVSETATLTATFSAFGEKVNSITEYLIATGTASSKQTAYNIVATALVMSDVLNGGKGGNITDSATIADAVVNKYNALLLAVDACSITDAVSPILSLTAIVPDNITISDSLTVGQTINLLISEGIELLVTYRDTDTYSGWVMNPHNSGVTNTSGWNFNSLAKFQNTYYGVNENGIYTLDGTTDDGEFITARVKTASLALGVRKQKRINSMLLGLAADGRVELKMINDQEKESRYQIKPHDEGIQEVRIKTGKGHKGMYWQADLTTIDCTRFDLDTVEFHPVVLGRNIR